MKFTAVILAKTDSEASHTMTLNCINSLIASEPQLPMEVIVVESNKQFHRSGFAFPDFVNVIVPEAEFNFHKFLNIGIIASKGDFIALCNNDLIFGKQWFSAIQKVSEAHSDIVSFSPSGTYNPSPDKAFELGYRVMIHLMGWCFVVKREIFTTIGLLDETFDFYYADNDYGMTLKYHNLKHAIVYGSHVEHLEKPSDAKKKAYAVDPKTFLHRYKIPTYVYKHHQSEAVLGNEKSLRGFIAYHNKWGSPAWLWRKNRLADILIKNNLGFLVRFFLKIK